MFSALSRAAQLNHVTVWVAHKLASRTVRVGSRLADKLRSHDSRPLQDLVQVLHSEAQDDAMTRLAIVRIGEVPVHRRFRFGIPGVKADEHLTGAIDDAVELLTVRVACLHVAAAAEETLIPGAACWNIPYGNEWNGLDDCYFAFEGKSHGPETFQAAHQEMARDYVVGFNPSSACRGSATLPDLSP